MNRTIKEATVQRYHYDSQDQITQHLDIFFGAYNFDRSLKTLKGLTRYAFIRQCWTNEPERFTLDPHHQMLGLNTQRLVRRRNASIRLIESGRGRQATKCSI